jgi:two-component system chemotaxis response regulator CheB
VTNEPSVPERAPTARAEHHTVVVGASAGGVEALRRLVAELPPDFPASVFVVLHLPPNSHSALPQILERAGQLPVHHAVDGEAPVPGVIYVAPPDAHLILHHHRVSLLHGPTENGHRPAIDPLFRSAAAAYGPRVIGVILSGALDDGAAGLLAVSRAGGITMVQSPADALYPSMPLSALDAVPVDVVADVDVLSDRLVELTHRPLPRMARMPDGPHADYTERALEGGGAFEMNGRPSRFTCPDCGGSLWESVEETETKFRCRVGHAWTAAALLHQQADTLEQALWTALRALAERADLARRMRDQAAHHQRRYAVRILDRQLRELEENADVVREVLRQPDGLLARSAELLALRPTDRDLGTPEARGA